MSNQLLRSVAAALLVAAAACSGEPKKVASATPVADAPRVDPSTSGSITGRVAFEGEVPRNPPVRISADPACIRANAEGLTFENYVVKDGGLDNVFVHVKDGLGHYYFDVPAEPVKLDQRGCRYTPHILGIRVGQPLEVGNSDETMHNVHALPDANQESNYLQFKKGQTNRQVFTTAEVMVPFKCDLHGWMNAFIGVVDHPYFAVTTEGGRFELKNVPAGEYTVEAWHAKAGRQTQTVTVGAKESRRIDFTYTAPAGN